MTISEDELKYIMARSMSGVSCEKDPMVFRDDLKMRITSFNGNTMLIDNGNVYYESENTVLDVQGSKIIDKLPASDKCLALDVNVVIDLICYFNNTFFVLPPLLRHKYPYASMKLVDNSALLAAPSFCSDEHLRIICSEDVKNITEQHNCNVLYIYPEAAQFEDSPEEHTYVSCKYRYTESKINVEFYLEIYYIGQKVAFYRFMSPDVYYKFVYRSDLQLTPCSNRMHNVMYFNTNYELIHFFSEPSGWVLTNTK